MLCTAAVLFSYEAISAPSVRLRPFSFNICMCPHPQLNQGCWSISHADDLRPSLQPWSGVSLLEVQGHQDGSHYELFLNKLPLPHVATPHLQHQI